MPQLTIIHGRAKQILANMAAISYELHGSQVAVLEEVVLGVPQI